MGVSTFVDLEIIAVVDEDEDNKGYLINISAKDLNSLVSFDKNLELRHWDGNKPVSLVAYGSDSVRTEGDATEDNNLTKLPTSARSSSVITK
jgi:hypothetical protein